MSEFCSKFSKNMESVLKEVMNDPSLKEFYDNRILAALVTNDELFEIATKARIQHKLQKLRDKF